MCECSDFEYTLVNEFLILELWFGFGLISLWVGLRVGWYESESRLGLTKYNMRICSRLFRSLEAMKDRVLSLRIFLLIHF